MEFGFGRGKRYCYLKRGLDALFSALLLLFLLLPMLLIAVMIRLTSRGPALFRQVRVGRNGAHFVCLKFRTMVMDAPADCPSSEMAHDRFVTPLGRFLRRTSLDELPQLWNVLLGQMSLVGPRPLIPNEGEVHEWRRRGGVYRLRPGMTGLSQISGRDFLPDAEKARLDVRYARSLSFRTDLSVLLRTISRIFSGDGIQQNSSRVDQ